MELNIYDLIGLEEGSSIEEIKEKMNKIEELDKRDLYSKKLIELIRSEYIKVCANKLLYDKNLGVSSPFLSVVNAHAKEVRDNEEKRYKDEDDYKQKTTRYKLYRNNNKKTSKGLNLSSNAKKTIKLFIAGTLVLVSIFGGFKMVSTNFNKESLCL